MLAARIWLAPKPGTPRRGNGRPEADATGTGRGHPCGGSPGALARPGGDLHPVRAAGGPVVGWGSVQSILALAGSAILVAAFAFNELRSRNPLLPFAILRVKGLLNASQQVGSALGLAILSVLVITRTNELIASPSSGPGSSSGHWAGATPMTSP